MLDRMRHAWHVVLVTEIPHVDIKRCASFVRLGIVGEQNLEAVRQPDDPVGPVVQ